MKKIINKCKDDSGSALILVIFAMVIMTGTIFILTKQVSNQVVSNKRNEKGTEGKYAAEAGIESAISEAMKSIEVKEEVITNHKDPSFFPVNSMHYRYSQASFSYILENLAMNRELKVDINKEPNSDTKIRELKIDLLQNEKDENGNIISVKEPRDSKLEGNLRRLYWDGLRIHQIPKNAPDKTDLDKLPSNSDPLPSDQVNNESNLLREDVSKIVNDKINILNNGTYNDFFNEDIKNSKVFSEKEKQNIQKNYSKSLQYSSYMKEEMNDLPYTLKKYDQSIDEKYIQKIMDKDLKNLKQILSINIDETLDSIIKSIHPEEEGTKGKGSSAIDDFKYIQNNIKSILEKDREFDEVVESINMLKESSRDFETSYKNVINISNKLDDLSIKIGETLYENKIKIIRKDDMKLTDDMKNIYGEVKDKDGNLDKEYYQVIIRLLMDRLRVELKASQINLKYIKYKINRAFLNQYNNELSVEVSKNIPVLNECKSELDKIKIDISDVENIRILEDIKLQLKGDNSLQKKISDIENNIKEDIISGKNLNFKNDKLYYDEYDKKISELVNSKQNKPKGNIVDTLEVLDKCIKGIMEMKKDPNFPENNLTTILKIEGKLKTVRRDIESVRYVLNNVYSEGSVRFPELEDDTIKIIYPNILNLSWDNVVLYNENNKKIEYKLESVGHIREKKSGITRDASESNQVISIVPGGSAYLEFKVMYTGLVYSSNKLEEEYAIEANVVINVEHVKSEKNYKLSYDINDWRYKLNEHI